MNGKGWGASLLNRSGWHLFDFPFRRRHYVAAAVSIVLLHPVVGSAHNTRWAAPDGAVILFRHANAPGVGDPENFRRGDCSTQRNLDAAGREQARAWLSSRPAIRCRCCDL